MEQLYKDPRTPLRMREGLLGAYVDEFAQQLIDEGYARASARYALQLVADLGRWLRRCRMVAAQLTPQNLARYLQHRSRQARHRSGDGAILGRLLRLLRDKGIVAQSPPVFPSARGSRLSADGVQYLLAKHVVTAAKTCPSLQQRRVTPHMLRHTTAMELLQAGVDRAVIALWLGHESVETTQIYLDANLAMKEQALARTTPPEGKPGRYLPDDRLLAFLKGL